jgi:hypothetical protein
MICLRARDDRRFLRDCAAMRMLAMTVVVLVLSVGVQARVWTTVYRCDERTPLVAVDPNHPTVYQDIMVGTKLVVVIGSDTELGFFGWLQFPDDGVMSLNGRRYDPGSDCYTDSVLPAAGSEAGVVSFVDLGARGFNLATGFDSSSGAWFIFDYRAERAGSCGLELYDVFVDWNVPVNVLSFAHIPSCDFNNDTRVDFEDFALLASHNSPLADSITDDQTAFDLNSDRVIDFRDLAQFSGHWLERIACDTPLDPNQPAGL